MKKMLFLSVALAATTHGVPAFAQTGATDQPATMSYTVTNYGGWPQNGHSNQLIATLSLNDSTGAVEKFGFQVPLMSFIDSYGRGYSFLARLGNYWYYPDMAFTSTSIEKIGTDLHIHGTLNFRGQNNSTILFVTTQNTGKTITLKGSFELYSDDFMMFMPIGYIPPTVHVNFETTFELPAQTSPASSK